FTFSSRFTIFPTLLITSISSLFFKAIPAESYPLYSRFLNPFIKISIGLSFPIYPIIPHIIIFLHVKNICDDIYIVVMLILLFAIYLTNHISAVASAESFDHYCPRQLLKSRRLNEFVSFLLSILDLLYQNYVVSANHKKDTLFS